jgi:hypothetical protein
MPVPPLVVLLKRWRLADRFHSAKNLSEAVAELLARVLTEIKAAPPSEAAPEVQGEVPLPVEEWRPTPGAQVTQAISTRRTEREARYQQVDSLHKQGLASKEFARRLGISERTVRHWHHQGVAPDTRPHATIPVFSIPTRRMSSGAGKKGSATARTFGAKSQPKAIRDHNGCSIAFSKR